ncbi:hypothetical protein [Sediminispirochaeta smaragdinae]|uniref:Uncharacterized protein n=1 Tax=Sediminispirochaeta smaragdinae (strain DSM 11293 / JCM 15392 / SEBR 4228) TaxID=573413 RepID=E1R1F7_SEDSS|nr:hypothetical protein [Sediminispirochaeta smaragdinae]ADK81098.1 hypothetical protein Spirs_1976 [Sediminispirochaeta smaragdinae DSM 11293]
MTERQEAITSADMWFSRYIRARDRWRSVTSGCKRNLTCSHLFSRRFYATRWDEMNAYCQSAGENEEHDRNPGKLICYFITLHGEDAYKALYLKSRSGVKITTEEIRTIAQYYRKKYEAITQQNHDFFGVL